MTAVTRQSARRPSEPVAGGAQKRRWHRWATVGTRLVILASAVGAIVLTIAVPTSASKPGADRYAGTWYEIARVPDRALGECEGDVTAVYRPLKDGSVRIIDRCQDGKPGRGIGVGHGATDKAVARPSSQGEGWRVMLDSDDRYSVVSDSQRKNLRILSRTLELDASSLDHVVSRLRAQGYPVDLMVPTGRASLRMERVIGRRAPPMT